MSFTKPKNNPSVLLGLAGKGDKDAFGELYEVYFVPVYRYIYLRLGKKEETEDLVQTVFLKIYKATGVFENQNKDPLAYFFTVARNTLIDYFRKKKEILSEDIIRQADRESDGAPGPVENAIQKELREEVAGYLGLISEDQREVLILKFIDGLPAKTIAQILNKSEEAVRQLQSRGLKAIGQILKEKNGK